MGALDQLRGFASNRTAQLAVAGGAGIGVLALIRHRGSAGGASAAEQTAAVAGGSVGGGQGSFPDTSGTDLATAIGDWDEKYYDALSDYSKAVSDNTAAIEALGKKQKADIATVTKQVNALKPKPKPIKTKVTKSITITPPKKKTTAPTKVAK